MTTLVWLQRECRLNQHPALEEALAYNEPVIIAYFHDAKTQIGDANATWLAESLQRLQYQLQQKKGQLWLIEGDFTEQFDHLLTTYPIKRVHYSFQVGSPFAQQQQTALHLCQKNQVSLIPFFSEFWFPPEQLLNKQHKPYLVFTPFYKFMQSQLHRLAPLDQNQQDFALSSIHPRPDAFSQCLSLQTLLDTDWGQKIRQGWHPGEEGAWQRLDHFVREALDDYAEKRDFPALAATSQLAPHLHFGELPSRSLYFYLQAIMSEGERKAEAVTPWIRQLIWREFARTLLFFFPETEQQAFQTKYHDNFWLKDSPQLRLWQQGKTGIPIIDAGMRELWQTGFMHNRVRMLTASLLTKNLELHWQLGKAWFDHTLFDADPANNTMGWQWVAGCGVDAAPYYRLFNPVKQSEKFDPEGHYLRQWLPELALLSNKAIHAPWEHLNECRQKGIQLGKDYPLPIVDLAQSRQQHLEKQQQLKRTSLAIEHPSKTH